MSIKSAADFITLVNQDRDLRSLIEERAESQADRAARAVSLGADRGYVFTSLDYLRVLEELSKAYEGELDDSDLDAVAGGVGGPPPSFNLFRERPVGGALEERLSHSPYEI
jgi:hypothetical protein